MIGVFMWVKGTALHGTLDGALEMSDSSKKCCTYDEGRQCLPGSCAKRLRSSEGRDSDSCVQLQHFPLSEEVLCTMGCGGDLTSKKI